MSPVTIKFTILALASSALAIPYHGGHHHHHYSGKPVRPTGTGAPYGYINATGIYGATGTGASSGVALPSSSSEAGPTNVAPSAVGPHTQTLFTHVTEYVTRQPESVACSDNSTIYSTFYNTVTVTSTAGASNSSEAAAVTASGSSLAMALSAYESAPTTSSTTGAASIAMRGANHRHSHSWGVHSSSATSIVAATSSASSSSSVYVPPTSSTSSAEASPVETSAISSSSSTAPTTSSSSAEVSPVETSATSSSTYVVPTSTSLVAYSTSSSLGSYSSSTSSDIASPTGSTTLGKRGCAYNDISYCSILNSTQLSWGYNWSPTAGGSLSGLNYVPILQGLMSYWTDGWNSAAQASLDSGSTHLLSFNEPDNPNEANIDPQTAISGYKTYMMPFAGNSSIKLGAPAVSNNGSLEATGDYGLSWLATFLAGSQSAGYQIDVVPIHWYANCNATSLAVQVNAAYKLAQHYGFTDAKVWITEFGISDGSSDADISSFLQEIMPWLDSQDYVERYSYFMASDGLLIDGTDLSGFGSTFSTYSSSTVSAELSNIDVALPSAWLS